MPVIMVVMMQVMVSVVNFVNHRSTCHEQHALGHGVVEEMEERSAKGYNDDGVVDVVIRILRAVCEVFVPVKGVGKVESSTESSKDVSELRHR